MTELLAVVTEAIREFYTREIAVFALSAAFVATFIWALDLVVTWLFNTESLLGLGYGGARGYSGARTFKMFCLWGLGAGLAGYLGGLAELFDIQSPTARIIVGGGWPTVLPRLIALSDEAGEEPDETQEEEAS